MTAKKLTKVENDKLNPHTSTRALAHAYHFPLISCSTIRRNEAKRYAI